MLYLYSPVYTNIVISKPVCLQQSSIISADLSKTAPKFFYPSLGSRKITHADLPIAVSMMWVILVINT